MKKELVIADTKDVVILGQIMSTEPNRKARGILNKIFGSRLSYTRGEPNHTAFLEGQKSVIQFIENAVLTAKRKAEGEQ